MMVSWLRRATMAGVVAPPPPLDTTAYAPWPAQPRSITLLPPSPWAIAMVGIGAVFFVLALLAYPRSLGGPQVFNSPRENVGYVLSQQLVQGDGFSYPLLHYGELPPDIGRALTPRDAAELDGYVVPKDFAGTMLFHAPLFAIWEPLVLLVTPLFALLSAFVLFKIGEELFDRRAGFVAFVAWLAYPPLFVNGSYIFTSDTISLTFLLGAALFFLRYWRERQTSDLALLALSLGAATLMRYPNAALILVFAAALWQGKRLSGSQVAMAAGLLAPFALTILVFNRLVYGDATVTGFHLGARLLADTVQFSDESFLKLRPEVVSGYLQTYVLEWPVMLAPQLLGLVFGCYAAWRRADLRVPIVTLLAVSLLVTGYYLPQDAWGWTEPEVNASLLRYLLPALALWTLFLAYGLLLVPARWLPVAGVGAAVLLAAYASTSWWGAGGVADAHHVVDEIGELRTQVVASTEPDAIIATRIMDKVLFPQRQTLTMTYLLDSEGPIEKGRRSTWQFLPEQERFADVAVRIYQSGVPLYLLADFDWRIAQQYDEELRLHGFRLRHMRTAYPYFQDIGFYKIVPLSSAKYEDGLL